VLLELLSGKKAYEINEGNVSLLTDWAWSLAREGRGLDIIEENLPEMGLPEVMEQYVHIALTCAHPLLHARPTFDQIVNMLETNMPVPSSLEAYIAASSLEICSISSSYNFTSSIRVMRTNSDNLYDRKLLLLSLVCLPHSIYSFSCYKTSVLVLSLCEE
jgi:hypothetical protein